MPDALSLEQQQALLDCRSVVLSKSTQIPREWRDDVVQESLMKLARHLDRVSTSRDPAKYIAKTVWNCYREQRRAAARRNRRVRNGDSNCLMTVEERQPKRVGEAGPVVTSAVRMLRKPYRQIVEWQLEGKSIADFARDQQLSPETCRTHLRRGLQRLAEMPSIKALSES